MTKSSQTWGFSRAFVYDSNRVYILAHLPELEEQRVHFTQVLRWTGDWATFRIDWACTALCAISQPEPTLLSMSPEGRIHLAVASGFSEEMVDDSDEGPAIRGILRDIRVIGQYVYVTGMGRQVYRRESPGYWVRIDKGVVIPATKARIVGFNSISGFSEEDIYAAGWAGEIWHYNGYQWQQLSSPTNLKLERLICAQPETLYACGQMGLLLRGDRHKLEVIEHGVTEKQFWGMEWFQDRLWLATDNSIYYLDNNDELISVDLGMDETSVTCGWLHAQDGVMWSVGGQHLLSTKDGQTWELHLVP